MIAFDRWTRRRAAFLSAALLALFAAGCDSPDQDERSDASAALAETAEAGADLPLGDPAKGDVLVLGGGLKGLATAKASDIEFFDASKRAFARSGKIITNRIAREAVVLDEGRLDGQALLTGGLAGEGVRKKSDLTIKGKALDTAEAFDPDKGKSAKLPAKLSVPRFGHTETLLKDGRVLIAGGFDSSGKPQFTTELFDPATRTFKEGGGLKQSRALHSATLLPDGRVLIAGGVSTELGDTNGSGEVFDPTTNETIFTTNFMQSPNGPIKLAGHSATLIEGCSCDDDGKVLIAGGFEGFRFSDRALETASTVVTLYDPATNSFSSTGLPQMTDDRMLHTATALPNGKILIAGGIYGQGFFAGKKITGVFGGVLASAEVYDIAKREIACVGGKNGKRCSDAMANSRVTHGALLIEAGPLDGKVLLVGGAGGKARTTGGKGAPLNTAEIYDPKKNEFKAAGSMKAARIFPALALAP
ncbi:hypothetical protein IHQ68_01350 [Chelatococcus sambhunathii]|uniref:Uncharacterized protein n=1 Tax=Chelatococcus sambhunathii TaxID=363953 RepID=A0ABU1DBH5_9HYPH|nr:kelch repeat-containing protein [Chelatococcus sambhunathii]MDR4305270.1 hypothetical protein [Chelatococcus sambhunathii]